jgi:hypothetical protein
LKISRAKSLTFCGSQTSGCENLKLNAMRREYFKASECFDYEIKYFQMLILAATFATEQTSIYNGKTNRYRIIT